MYGLGVKNEEEESRRTITILERGWQSYRRGGARGYEREKKKAFSR